MFIDLHCHILPGIDDGARNLDQSLAMARIAVADGIKTSLATPHHLNGAYHNPAESVRANLLRLAEALQRESIPLQVLPGAELHLVPELPEALREGTAMTIADRRRAVLVELPVHHIPHGAEQVLEAILAQGLTPVIAHPERNSELRKKPERLAQWVASGCLGQVTAQSCTGHFGRSAQQTARLMIQAGSIHVVASDAHRDHRRVPVISSALSPITKWTSTELATLLMQRFPADLADGRQPDTALLEDALPRRTRRRWSSLWLTP
ncbi:MAG: hypothetical protein LC637_01185 [Xanthomonadaceae bacterium]|nr:hypothetical protein [Xanthomonadaceae bacterium]